MPQGELRTRKTQVTSFAGIYSNVEEESVSIKIKVFNIKYTNFYQGRVKLKYSVESLLCLRGSYLYYSI